MLGSNFGLLFAVNVSCYRNTEFLADLTEDTAAFLNAGSAKGIHGCTIRLIERGFEYETDTCAICDIFERVGHAPCEVLRFQGAWTKDEKGVWATDGNIANLERLERHEEIEIYSESSV